MVNVPNGNKCPECGAIIGFWTVYFRSPINVICPHCNTRSQYEDCLNACLTVIFVTFGLVLAVYSHLMNFIVLILLCSVLNGILVLFLRAKRRLVR
jgi:rubredoxin